MDDKKKKELRKKAEEKLSPNSSAGSEAHELQVHQIELEMQNRELLQIQEDLEIAKERYLKLFEEAPLAYALVNEKGRVKMVNSTLARLFGQSKDSFFSKTIFDYFVPEDKSVFLHRFPAFFKKPQGKTMQLALDKSRPLKYLQVQGKVFKGLLKDDSKLVLLSFNDITKRIRAEKLVKQEKENWKKTFEKVPIMLCLLDDNYNVIRGNRAFLHRVGNIDKEYVGKRCHQVFCDSSEPAENCFLRGVFNEDSDITEFYSKKLQGTFICRINKVALFSTEKPHYILSLQEITRLKAQEKEELQLQKQVLNLEKQESLNTMAGAIAHRLNNIINVISGRVELIKSEKDLPSSIVDDINEIEIAAGQAAKIGKSMLLSLGKDFSHQDKIDLNGKLRQLIRKYSLSLPNYKINFVEGIKACQIKINQAYFEMLFKIIFTNAQEALESEGEEILICSSVFLKNKKRFAEVEISDNGKGMDEETLRKVFDPFFSTKFPGRGMGLSVAQGIMQMSEGELKIESSPGQGTKVILIFPAL